MKKYKGWSNFETCHVNETLKLTDIIDVFDSRDPDKLEVELMEYVEEQLISDNLIATIFAISYLNRVYWNEIVAVGLANLKEKAEIKDLEERTTRAENKAFEYEKEACRLREQLNNEIQTIPSCGNCKKVKELEAEIKDLEVHITWAENKAFEYEDEAYRLRKQLNSLL